MVAARVDTLVPAFRGVLKPTVRAELEQRLAAAKELRTDVEDASLGMLFRLNQRSRTGRWWWANADARVEMNEEQTQQDWGLAVTIDAKFLAQQGAEAALELARRVAEGAIVNVQGERVRRVDLAVDVADLSPADIEIAALLTHGAKVRQTHKPLQDANGRSRLVLQTIEVGKRDSPFFLRIYDKRAELAENGDTEKLAIESAIWAAKGVNDDAPITRVEAQVSSEALRQFGFRDDPDEVLRQRPAIWRYVVHKKVRLVVPSRRSETHPERALTHPTWKVVQEADFGHWDGEMLTRDHSRGTDELLRGLSTCLSGLAGKRVLRPLSFGRDACAHIREWSDQRCALFVEGSLKRLLGVAGVYMAEDLVARKGPRDACATLMEKWNAACARAAHAGESRAAEPAEKNVAGGAVG